MNKFFFYLLIISFFVTNNAFAYLDPGTTGIIFSTLVGIIIACLAYIKSIYFKIKSLFFKFSGTKPKIDPNKKN